MMNLKVGRHRSVNRAYNPLDSDQYSIAFPLLELLKRPHDRRTLLCGEMYGSASIQEYCDMGAKGLVGGVIEKEIERLGTCNEPTTLLVSKQFAGSQGRRI